METVVERTSGNRAAYSSGWKAEWVRLSSGGTGWPASLSEHHFSHLQNGDDVPTLQVCCEDQVKSLTILSAAE